MIYCVNRVKAESQAGSRTAGKKAPDDVAAIVGGMPNGAVLLFEEAVQHNNPIIGKLQKAKANLKNWNTLYKSTKAGDIVVLQHPYEGIRGTAKHVKDCTGVTFIAFIHDLFSLRNNIERSDSEHETATLSKAEMEILHAVDFIICHNEAMKAWLVMSGINEEKIITLCIFDYLHECTKLPLRCKTKSVAVAGNLLHSKCEYLYKLMNTDFDFDFHLYGPNYTGNSERVIYHGIAAPNELPGILEGSFGLVWDGTGLDGCKGNAGEYIRYNNPHKTSLYLSSGLPVIIWKEAAMADFVEKNGVGITVSSLNEIGQALDRISKESYQTMAANARKIGEKLRAGYYTKTAVEKCLMRLGI